MAFADILKRSESYVGENASTILTAVGVTGTVTTAYLTGRATFKAAEILQKENSKIRLESDGLNDIDDLDLRDKAMLVWSCYIPPIGVGATTIVSIVMANHLSSRKAAALAAAYGISERAFQEYKDKVVEKFGQNKATAIRDEVAQDRIKQHPVNTREIIIAGAGEVLCYDMLTGRYFQSTVEEIKKAQNRVNEEIINHMYASLSSFYDHIGLPSTMFSDDVGFNTDNMCEIQFSTVMSIDDRPCVALGFHVGPVENYKRLY